MEVRYVYDNTEVIKTGRIARKQQPANTIRRSDRSPTRLVEQLHEVTPASSDDGCWKKWVKQTDLYEIIDEQNNRGIEEEDLSAREEGSITDGESCQ